MLLWIIHTGHYWRFGEERSPRRELKITGLKHYWSVMLDFNSGLSTYGNKKVDVLVSFRMGWRCAWKKGWLKHSKHKLLLTFIRTVCTDLARTSISDQLFRVTMVIERRSEVRSYLCWDFIKRFVPNSCTCKRSTPSRNDSETGYVSVQVAFGEGAFLFLHSTELWGGNAGGEHDAVLPRSIFLPFTLCLVYI